ncbi:MAG: S41 family peptidase [candidate division WOR-3 bacterium]|nr:MAG: S41 family peptidase [candidate division WOR-3 bacterium]
MYNNIKKTYILVTVFFLLTQIAAGEAEEITMDSKTKKAVIGSVNRLIIERYVIRDIAQQIAEHLSKRFKNGSYDKLLSSAEFARALAVDLRESSSDNHFYIEYNPERAKLVTAEKSQSPEEIENASKAMAEKERLTNFGFKKVEILKGNVGYLDLDFFSNPDYAGETAVAAMNFLANSDAVIIDLRDTPGGEPTMVQMLSSYFVRGTGQGRTHLNTLEQVYDGKIEQYWTMPYVPGKRMYDTDLYILTDGYTGSGAEEFTHNMKALDRAVIIGETTVGSGHNVDIEVIQESFVMHLPVRRPVNPITGTGWEGTGIEPHISVPGKQALDKAYLMALEKIMKNIQNESKKFHIVWAIDGVRARIEPITIDDALLRQYAGEYGERKITYENGELYYQRTGPKYRLIPLKDNLFTLEGLDYFRIEMLVDKKGTVKELVGIYDNGRRDASKRTK